MTERLALGITVGALNSVAVAASGDAGDVETDLRSGGVVRTHPSVLRLAEHAAPVFGAAALRRSGHSRDVVIDDFLDRVGDPVDMLAEDGSTHAAADLMATAVGCLIDETASAATDAPDAVVACHPARWSEHTVRTQRAALTAAGLPEVTLVPEQSAAVRWLEAAHGPLGTGAVLVYDLGATGLTLSVVRTGAQAGPLGPSLRNTDIAGAEFDLLTMRYVLANALNGNEFDPFDPAAERELSALRARCRNAKESLSINTATVVPVRLDPSAADGQQIRLVRDELEELLRGPLLTSLDLMRDAIHRAGLDISDVGTVLLTGGGASIPLVAELVSTEFGLPVVAADDPALTSARGAALLAADLIDATVATTPQPLVAQPSTELATTRVAVDRAPIELPPTAPEPRRDNRKRVAVIAAAVVAIGLLASGTVAIGTGVIATSNPPASEQNSATTGQQTTTAGADGSAPAQPVADPLTAGSQPAQTPGAPPGSAASPGTSAVAVANSPEQPQNTQGQPAAGQPAAPPQAQATQPGQPAPAGSPAPQPQPQTQPQPQPQPVPQPIPTQQIPVPNPQPTQPKPQPPSLPTGALENTIDGVGGAVGTVLQLPGEILGGNGG